MSIKSLNAKKEYPNDTEKQEAFENGFDSAIEYVLEICHYDNMIFYNSNIREKFIAWVEELSKNKK